MKLIIKSMLLSIVMITTASAVELTVQQRKAVMEKADMMITCAVGIRQSFGQFTRVPNEKGEEVLVSDIAYDIYKTAEQTMLTISPNLTEDIILEQKGIKNTMWLRLTQESKEMILQSCFSILQGDKKNEPAK